MREYITLVLGELAAWGIAMRSPGPRGVVEEASGAYKDVSAVVVASDGAGLASLVARPHPPVDLHQGARRPGRSGL